MTPLRRQLLALLLAGTTAAPAFAQATNAATAPEALVRTVTNDVMAAIRGDAALQAGDRDKALALAEQKVLPHVDFAQAARLAVGRHWNAATPEQRMRIADRFRALLIRTYSSAIGTYEGQAMRVLPLRAAAGEDDVTVRNQFLSPGRPPVAIDYAMRRGPDGWKIYDITVEGVSLVLTYRSQFDREVRAGGIDGLLRKLEEMTRPARS